MNQCISIVGICLLLSPLAFAEQGAAEAEQTAPAEVPIDVPAEVPIEEFESGRMDMVQIPAGSFEMGVSGGFVAQLNSKTQSATIERDFMISKYEVSVGLYASVMTGESTPGQPESMLPAREVTWFDAARFCNKLSELEGFEPAYVFGDSTSVNKDEGQVMSVSWRRDSNGYRLPTEAEWEYAARGGTGHSFGTTDRPADVCSTDNLLDQTRWNTLDQEAQEAASMRGYGPRRKPSRDKPVPCEDGAAGVAPVGSYSANPYGLHDMLGNVREWVWAWQNIKRMRTPAKVSQWGDGDPDLDKMVSRSVMHIVRGHSYIDGLAWAHVGGRGFRRPHKSSGKVGFRVVRNAP